METTFFMASLPTQCPHCHTSFRVSESQMAAADGFVRCGSCLQIFSAEKHKISLLESAAVPEQSVDSQSNIQDQQKQNTESHTKDEAGFKKILSRIEQQIESHIFGALLEPNNYIKNPSKFNFESFEKEPVEKVYPKLKNENNPNFYGGRLNPNNYLRTKPVISTEPLESILKNEVSNNTISFATFLNPFNYHYMPLKITTEQTLDKASVPEVINEEPSEDSNEESNEEPNEETKLNTEQPQVKINEEISPTQAETLPPESTQQLKESVEQETINEDITKEKTDPTTNKNIPPRTKKEVHQNLSKLNDDESLEPVSFESLAGIDDEPVVMNNYVQSKHPFRNIGLMFANLFLTTTLLGQYIFNNFESLSINPRYQSSIETLCDYLECPIIERHDLSNIYTEQLVIRSHPTITNALQVSFIFRNEAEFNQPLPLAELNFTDLNNRLVSNRLFTPEEYLPLGLKHITHINRNTSIQVVLDLVDPGKEAINYSLAYRIP